MNYKILFLTLFLFLTNCATDFSNIETDKQIIKKAFVNKGFTLIYSDILYSNKIIEKKLMKEVYLYFKKI